ncbi:hypothetical protein QBC33DRAFT_89617 [Phialemonium atrogriseum]|uniref:Uncharacterized protein n=1 Tax=Phialemonium atrogriseum TaxID=1093897 RepID=A0AAJ0C182_9PEZI|nr:uncharacterized protein QBC33DRAFT_89617 [Phialemonium atrogriseum]KAK1766807.1 hypothetical protein QBC33DRAFT_89617 [Phialemonium atrogriseum]
MEPSHSTNANLACAGAFLPPSHLRPSHLPAAAYRGALIGLMGNCQLMPQRVPRTPAQRSMSAWRITACAGPQAHLFLDLRGPVPSEVPDRSPTPTPAVPSPAPVRRDFLLTAFSQTRRNSRQNLFPEQLASPNLGLTRQGESNYGLFEMLALGTAFLLTQRKRLVAYLDSGLWSLGKSLADSKAPSGKFTPESSVGLSSFFSNSSVVESRTRNHDKSGDASSRTGNSALGRWINIATTNVWMHPPVAISHDLKYQYSLVAGRGTTCILYLRITPGALDNLGATPRRLAIFGPLCHLATPHCLVSPTLVR